MKFIIFLVVMAFCLPASAQTTASSTRTDRGWSYVLCDAETTDGICDGASGDMYVNVAQFEQFNVHFSEVGAGATCDIYGADIQTAMAADMSAYPHNKINGTSLSATQDAIGYTATWEYIWIKCATIDTSVTVTVRGAVGLHRDKR
jgi:hypothetical protein